MPYMIFKKNAYTCVCDYCSTIVHQTYLEDKYFKEFINSPVTEIHVLIAKWKALLALCIGSVSLAKLYKAICLHRGMSVHLFRYEDQPAIVIQPKPAIGTIYYLQQ